MAAFQSDVDNIDFDSLSSVNDLVLASTPEPTVQFALQEDDQFYFQDVHFLVENISFKVWRRNFEHGSSVFQEMFSLPTGAKASEGLSRDNPIILEGISANDFRQLLKVMYPLSSGDEYLLTLEQWVSVLKLATLWDFAAIREHALYHLGVQLGSDASRKVQLAYKYDVNEWLLPGLNALAQRAHPLDERDVDLLGISCVLKLGNVRERYTDCNKCSGEDRFGFSGLSSSGPFGAQYLEMESGEEPCTGRAAYDFTEHIKEIFEL